MKEKAQRKLMKEFQQSFSKKEQQKASFYVDREDEKHYIWSFVLNNRLYEWIFVYQSGIVVRSVCSI
ncbi:hypothetical protein [Tuberibacillus sp. Marseille-P3662]|uniref:hypothetical protein n=1 Tax=Tuberibacillus sp. Marseille-P3662 TaxID=1965358 RepID=UPI000A1CCC12|nr:hypothetical protein [Tuberibacillus sp. Marseille-P3662]